MENGPDPVESFLGNSTGDSASPTLQQAVLARTTHMLRRRRRYRQLALTCAFVCCYGAGLATTRLYTGWASGPPLQATQDRLGSAGPDLTPSQTLMASRLDSDPDVPALVFERIGLGVDTKERARFFCRAGDRYLQHDGDLSAALRCYARALEIGSASDLSVSPDDSWLLMALKQARLEERKHANDG
jgi:hypothetical protein